MSKLTKKSIALTAGVALAAALLIPGVALAGGWQPFAAGQQAPACQNPGTTCVNYVDEDGNGTCDNYENRTVRGGAGYVDENGDGVCDNYGANGCANYVDEDADGICDNYENREPAGPGYVDEDGDGICDNYGANGGGKGKNGRGMGGGYGMGRGCPMR